MQIAKILRLIVKKKTVSNSRIKGENLHIQNVIKKEFLSPLEEARLAVEEIVIPKGAAVELIPRVTAIRKEQHELLNHYCLSSISVGIGKNRRLRIYPK